MTYNDFDNKSNKHYDTTRLNSLSASRVAEDYGVTLKRKGAQSACQCLWHEDHNPSMVINEKTGHNYFHCFVCGQTASVIDFVMKHQGLTFTDACEQLSNRYGIPTGETAAKFIPVKAREERKQEEMPVAYIPMEEVEKTLSHDSNFALGLYKLFDPHLVDYVCDEYMLGRYDGTDLKGGEVCGGTVFWMIDEQQRVRNGKMQVYDCDVNSPSFMHYDKGNGRMQYLGWKYQRSGVVPSASRFDNNCLFGAHLLPRYPSATVVLVESPKNCIIGACEHPELLWVATGSESMLKEEVLRPLFNRKVIVFPDRDAISSWEETLKGMRHIAAFDVRKFCERMPGPEQPKYDIADYIISRRIMNVPF